MRRIKLILAVVAAMTMMMVVGAAPAMADEIDRPCFPFCDDNHHDNDRHDDFDHHDFDEFDVDDCVFVGFDGDEAVFVCEVDFD